MKELLVELDTWLSCTLDEPNIALNLRAECICSVAEARLLE